MHDWIAQLSRGQWILDIASASGSFSTDGLDCSVVAVDEDCDAFQTSARPSADRFCRLVARSERLPIASASIDLVICNHGLEHFVELNAVVDEIGRVLKPGGRLYVSVPDGHAFCDALYRWLFEGGGHVNRFRRDDLIRLIESRAGVHLAQWQNSILRSDICVAY